MRKPPKCPTCGTPLPTKPDPALPSEGGKRPDATREILRRLTVLEQRVAELTDGCNHCHHEVDHYAWCTHSDGPESVAERHQRHWQVCNCLADKASCCIPTCPCKNALIDGGDTDA